MTVAASDSRHDFTGNGSVSEFTFTFVIFTKNDLTAMLDGTVKTLDTHYKVLEPGGQPFESLAAASLPSAGKVKFIDAQGAPLPPASGVLIALLRNQPASQVSEYQANELFPALRLEKDYDKLAMLVQQVNEELRRRPGLQKHSLLKDLIIPEGSSATNRAKKYVRWNAAGTGLEIVSQSSDIIGVLDDVIPSYTLANLPPAGTAGRLARVTDDDRNIRLDTGSLWVSIGARRANVHLFGANGLGNNRTADIAAFTNALAYLNTSDGTAPGGGLPMTGGTLIVPRGVYDLTNANLTVGNSIRIVGEASYRGQAEQSGKSSVILTSSTSPTFILVNSSEIDGINFENYVESGIHVRVHDAALGDDQAGHVAIRRSSFAGGTTAVEFIGFGGFLFEENYLNNLHGSATDAVLEFKSITNGAIGNVIIRKNHANVSSQPTPTTSTSLIRLTGTGSKFQNFVFEDNRVDRIRQDNATALALVVESGSIRNNTFDDHNDTGSRLIVLTNSKGVIIEGNFFSNIAAPIVFVNTTLSRIGRNFYETITGNWIDTDSSSSQNIIEDMQLGGTYNIVNAARNYVFNQGNFRLAVGQNISSGRSTGTSEFDLIGGNTSDHLVLKPDGGGIRWGRPLVALGGGAVPTLGTIGGSGPTTAAQNSWMEVIDSNGVTFWVPVWK